VNMLRMSLRNTRRHPRRTLLTGLAICIAVAAVTYMDAHLKGIRGGIFETFIQLDAGHIKVVPVEATHRSRPLPLDKGIRNLREVLKIIESQPGITDVSPRIRFPVLMDDSGNSSYPAFGVALYPSRERRLMNLGNLLVEGEIPADSSRDALLGIKLSQVLGLSVGDELFVVTSDAYGGLGPGLYTVSGIVRSGLSYIDKKTFYVPLPAGQDQLDMNDRAMEIVCRVEDGFYRSIPVADSLNARLKQAGFTEVEALPWQGQGSLYQIMAPMTVFYWVLMLLLGAIAFTTIVNTVLMSVMERTREIGALRALGFDRGTVIKMILGESLVVGILGTIAGVTLGMTVALFLHNTGIDVSGATESIELPIRSIVYPDPSLISAIKAAIFGLILTLIAAWYPARVAVRLKPAEALRMD